MQIHFHKSFTATEVKLINLPINEIRDKVEQDLSGGVKNKMDYDELIKPNIEGSLENGVSGSVDLFVLSMDDYREIKSKLEKLATNEPRDQLCKDILKIIRG